MTEEFAVLCRQAEERGTKVLYEMLPAAFSRAPSLDAVLAICKGAGARNGGIMLDNLHLQRTATPPQDIVRKIPRALPLGVEINDGMLAMPVNLVGLGHQQTAAAGRRGIRHRRFSARGLDAGLSQARSASKC